MSKIEELKNRILKKKKPEEVIRETQRALNRVTRELDREQKKIETEEAKMIIQIKKAAKDGQEDAVKIMAQNLVRNRAYKNKFMVMKANIQAINMKLTSAKSMHAMSSAMKQVGASLKTINKQMDLPALKKILMDFEKETQMMDFKEEMMNDTMDDVFEGDATEEDMDKVVNRVFDELGIEMNTKLNLLGTPSALETQKANTTEDKVKVAATSNVDEDDLETRLNNLKKT